MKKEFSLSWKGSKQPRKQRKYRENIPLHLATKLLSANLSKDLRKKYGKRNFPLRNEDEVKIITGKFKGKTGKINFVDRKKLRVSVDGIQRKKKDGTKINVYFDPSNIQILNLNLNDKFRVESLSRKSTVRKEKQVKENKNVEKTETKRQI